MTLVEVILASAIARTNPKSAIFTSPSSEISTFSGLTSRCTSPCACATARPPSTGPQHRGHRVRRHRAALDQQFAQGAALDELHHQERVLAVDALVVDGDQAGILQPRDGAGLALEPGQELLVAGIAGVHDLQRHRPIQPDVQAAVHRRHAAGGDQGVDAVPPVQHSPDKWVRLLVGLHLSYVTEPNVAECPRRAASETASRVLDSGR